jgi:hypothetical protein
LTWLTSGFFMMAAAIIASGIAIMLPIPIMSPGEAAKSLVGVQLRGYGHTQVMRDAGRLLFLVGLVNIVVALHLFSGGRFHELEFEHWWASAALGGVYLSASLLPLFWFRFVMVLVWTCDVTYTSIFLGPRVSPSVFIPIGAYVTYQLWTNRKQILSIARPSVIAGESISYGFGLGSALDSDSDSAIRSKSTDG